MSQYEKALDSDLVYIGMDTLLALPWHVFEAISDVLVNYTNFGYLITAPLLPNLLVRDRSFKIIDITTGYRKSTSKIGDYRSIDPNDPKVHKARIVVPLRVWKTVLEMCHGKL